MRTEPAPAGRASRPWGQPRTSSPHRPRRGWRPAVLLGAVIGLGAAVVLSSLPRAAPMPRLHGSAEWGPGRRLAPSFLLRDQTGRPVSPADVRGHFVLLTFMDSHCTRACPVEGRMLEQTQRAIPPSARPVLMIVSVNPADTAASARRFAQKSGFAGLGPWHWLMGSPSALTRVWNAYGVAVKPSVGDIEHTTVVYLIDAHADERAAYGVPFPPSLLASDVLVVERGSHRMWHWPWS